MTEHMSSDKLLAFALDALDDSDRAAAREHLRECEACSAALRTLEVEHEHVSGALVRYAARAAPGRSASWSAVAPRILRGRHSNRRVAFRFAFGGLGGVVLVLVVAVGFAAAAGVVALPPVRDAVRGAAERIGAEAQRLVAEPTASAVSTEALSPVRTPECGISVQETRHPVDDRGEQEEEADRGPEETSRPTPESRDLAGPEPRVPTELEEAYPAPVRRTPAGPSTPTPTVVSETAQPGAGAGAGPGDRGRKRGKPTAQRTRGTGKEKGQDKTKPVPPKESTPEKKPPGEGTGGPPKEPPGKPTDRGAKRPPGQGRGGGPAPTWQPPTEPTPGPPKRATGGPA